MAWTFVDSDSIKQDASLASVATPGVTVAAGDLVCVLVAWEGGTTTCTVSDGTSSLTQWGPGVVTGSMSFVMFYLLSSVASGTNSVIHTATLGAGRVFRNMCVMVLRPPSGPAALDGTPAGAVGTGTVPASGNITTTSTDGAAFGSYAEFGSSLNTPTINGVAPANGVTPLRTTLWWSAFAAGFTSQATGSISSNDWGMGVMAFKPNTTPVITQQPGSQSVRVGDKATFNIAATTSGGTLHYDWEVDTGGGFANATGATDAPTYQTPTLVLGDEGAVYRCNVSDNNGTTVSASATLHVRALGQGNVGGFDRELRLTGWY